MGSLKLTEAEAETGELSWNVTPAFTAAVSPMLNFAFATGTRTETLSAPEIVTEVCPEATWPFFSA